MNLGIKHQWVTALRSGKYRQGGGALRKSHDGIDTYCCLGVLCELAVAANVIPQPVLDGEAYLYGPWEEAALLPREVVTWAELPHENPLDLSAVNDQGSTFSKIADMIEENL